jgi:hypothetical protein
VSSLCTYPSIKYEELRRGMEGGREGRGKGKATQEGGTVKVLHILYKK